VFLVGFDFVLADLLVDLLHLSCEIRILCSICSVRTTQIWDFLPEEAELFQFYRFQCTRRVED
jgi:hypothetical protein